MPTHREPPAVADRRVVDSRYALDGHVGGSFGPLLSLPDEEHASAHKPSDPAASCYQLWQPKEVQEPTLPQSSQTGDTNGVMNIVAWKHRDLPTPFYIRIDRSASFHTYPDLGGPFQSLHEAEIAIDKHARGTCQESLDKLSRKERAIHSALYWRNGTKRICTRSQSINMRRDDLRRLVQALLDKYNDDQDSSEDHAYELKDIVHWQSICEGFYEWYYHLNITVKTKVAADFDAGSGNLFFAEVTRVHKKGQDPGFFLSCFCRVEPDHNDKGRCYGCTNNGSVDMKHPLADEYTGGHMNVCLPFGPSNEMDWRDSKSNSADEADMMKAEEDRIRRCFKYFDNEAFMEKYRKLGMISP